jgi:hypothetical protein
MNTCTYIFGEYINTEVKNMCKLITKTSIYLAFYFSFKMGLGLWCLMLLSTILQLYCQSLSALGFFSKGNFTWESAFQKLTCPQTKFSLPKFLLSLDLMLFR